MKVFLLVLCFLSGFITDAQSIFSDASINDVSTFSNASTAFGSTSIFSRKLYQRNTGVIIGLQRGRYTSIELGGEAHWRKISFLKPHVIGATANMEYNFSSNVVGYKAGMWMKRGHINLTYGANVSYFTDFKDGHKFGIGPSIGFRLLGFHLINGYNFLTESKTVTKEGTAMASLPVNTLYMSFRYYIPVENKFTWDRKTMKKKRERKRARAKRRDDPDRKKFLLF